MFKEIKMDAEDLLCPFCEYHYLHHEGVTIFSRTEDAPKHTKVHVSGSVVVVSEGSEGNPSPRRDGISIIFWCEGCENNPELNIYQHKGNTWVHWGRRL